MLHEIIAWIVFFFDLIIPRFVTEDVALVKTGHGCNWDAYDIECSMKDVEEWETFDAIATVDAFTWLGAGFSYRIWDLRPWSDRERCSKA